MNNYTFIEEYIQMWKTYKERLGNGKKFRVLFTPGEGRQMSLREDHLRFWQNPTS